MLRGQLSDMAIFVEVARVSGFRAAAARLKLSPASVSEAVQRFEDRLGVRLFERSTRSVALTPIGERLFERSVPAISDLEAALHDLDEQRDSIAGTLRLSAPYSAGPFFLDALLADFAKAYPDVSVELIYDDRKVDLISSKLDVAIRANTLLEFESHAVSIGPALNTAIVASRNYLDRRGEPRKPEDILEHDGLCFAFGQADRLASWMFNGPDGALSVMPKAKFVVNNLPSLVHYSVRGLGLAYVYAEVAKPKLADGSLVEVMQGQTLPLPRYSLNYRSKKNMTRRLRAFIDLAKQSAA